MALADLANQGPDATVPLSAIAERQGISMAYLEQLFVPLRRAGLVESTRGRLGGYRLGRPAAGITVAEIMSVVDEPTRMTRCFNAEGSGCIGEAKCLTHGLWHALGHQIRSFLASITLQQVIDGAMPLGAPQTSALERAPQ